MKLMTWNIRLGIQEGLEPVAEIIRDEAPDLVALQEVGRNWVMGPEGDTTALLARETGMVHSIFVPSLNWFPPAQYGHALLSRTPLSSPSVVRLPQDVDEARTYVVTRTAGIIIVGIHLSHIGDRPQQGAALVDDLEALHDRGESFILLGDLNESDRDTPWMARLADFATPAPADAPTFPAPEPIHRIDWIWSNVGSWSEARVVETGDVSDHRAVSASLALG